MQVIGLTGPSGAGKGYICQLFASYGIPSIDCDAITKEIYLPGSPCLLALEEAFGKEILMSDGTLHRKMLAERAFSSAEATQKLNEITHPWILKAVENHVEDYRKMNFSALILDAPTLLESGLAQQCDVCICVTAPEKIRKQRILFRDALTEAQAEQRLSAQPPISVYCDACQYEIINDGQADCKAQVEAILIKLQLL